MRFSGDVTAILTVSLALFLSSCQKVISVDLNQSNPDIVIEGLVNNTGGRDSVTINLTGDYFTPSLYFQPVTGATVIISDNGTTSDTLSESAQGIYYSDFPKGIPGHTYGLRVIAGNKEYDAVSTMPAEVKIDSFYVLRSTGPFGRSGYNFYVTFKDPPEPGNYYRIIPHIASIPNDSINGGRGGIHILDDKLTNGNEVTYRFGIRGDISNQLVPGDTLSVDLLSIDKNTYDYLYTLRNILEADQSPTSLSPANPNTNLTNGSLGYFSAYSIDTKRIIMK